MARPGSGRRGRHHRGSGARSRPQDQGRLRSDAALRQRSRPRQGRIARQGRRRESHRRSRESHAGCRGRLRRHLRHPGHHPLLPGTPRLRDPVAGRPGDGVAFHPVRHRLGRHPGAQPQGPRRQYQGQDGLHRRRLRQQVQPRSLGRSRRPPLAEGRRHAGQDSSSIAPPNSRSPATVPAPSARSKSPARRTAPSPPGNPTPGPAAVSPAAASLPCPTSTPTSPTRASITSSVSVNAGPAQAWRAPNNQQASFLTCSAIEDFAAKIGMDPMVVFDKNAGYTPRAEQYRYQLAEGRRALRMEQALEAARLANRRGPPRPRHRRQRLGRRGPRLHRPHHHQSRWLRAARNGHAGSGHRHAHHHDPGGCRNPRPPDGPDQARHRRQQPAAGRKFRRFHHRRRRLLGHPQIGRQRARQALRSGRARRSARSPRTWKPSTAPSASRATPRRA